MSPVQHFFRIEISGGHTGSSFRYHSGVFGTLKEVKQELRREFEDPQGLAFLFEAERVRLELYEDERRVGQWSLFPAVKLEVRRHVIGFGADGKIEGIDIKTPTALEMDPIVGPLLDGDVEPAVKIELDALAIPAPQGAPLKKGNKVSYERDGRTLTQEYGWVGAWDTRIHLGASPVARRRRS